MNEAINADPFSMNPAVWGPHVWATLHSMALKADADRAVEAFYHLLYSMTALLPCEACKKDYTRYLHEHGQPAVAETGY